MNNSKQNKDALGKGIRSLLQNIDADLKNTSGHLKPRWWKRNHRYDAYSH